MQEYQTRHAITDKRDNLFREERFREAIGF